jgi:hypothetical protein
MEGSVVAFEQLPDKARKRRKMDAPKPPTTPIETPGKTIATGVGISPLDPSRLVGSQRVGIIGLPGTGKSTCCKSLLSELQHAFPVINVFSGSEGDNPFYSDMIPKLFIQNKISQKGLKMFVNRQRLAIGYDSPMKDALLILDDCFETPHQLDNSTMRILFKQGRHLRASVWVVQQYVVDLKPYARSTTSAVFLFHCPSSRDRKLLFENYGSVFADYATFCACYNAICATPHTAMVILLNQGNQNILDTVFWYRPRLVPKGALRLCHPALWEHAARRTDDSRVDSLALLSCHSGDN